MINMCDKLLVSSSKFRITIIMTHILFEIKNLINIFQNIFTLTKLNKENISIDPFFEYIISL